MCIKFWSENLKIKDFFMNIWENSIKMDLGEVVCEEMDWFNLTQGRVQWRAILNTIMNI